MKIIYLIFMILFISCQEVKENTTLIQDKGSLDLNLNYLIEQSGGKESFLLPNSSDYEKIPQDKKNKINHYKIKLGQNLFHDPAIAISPKNPNLKYSYSCSSCHTAKAGFTSGNIQGIAEGGIGEGEFRFKNIYVDDEDADVQPLKVPSILNVAYQKNTLWNGQLGANHHNKDLDHLINSEEVNKVNSLGFDGVESQAIAGLEVHGLIKDDSVLEESWIVNNDEYIDLFKKAFPSNPQINKENVALAIASYGRTLISNKAPFQRYLKGEKSALSEREKKGAILFFGKAKCVSCHSGPSFSDGNFHSLGMMDLDSNENVIIKEFNFKEREGRYSFTKDEKDKFKFKTPGLYNLKDHHRYGHGSSFKTLRHLLIFKNNGYEENYNVDKKFLSKNHKRLYLTNNELEDLEFFLKESLYDSDLERYIPNRVISDLPFPNNDDLISLD